MRTSGEIAAERTPRRSGPVAEPNARRDRALASLCRGSTVVVAAAGAVPDLAAHGVDAKRVELTRAPEPAAGTVRTVVLADVLPGAEEKARALLDQAWALVKPGGRLVVLLPNAAAHPVAGARARRELQALLAPFGRAKLHGEQPFRWLLAYVKRPRPGESSIPRAVRERYRVLASLCRGRVLELGCGPGDLSAEVASLGHEVVGMDMNREKIGRARERHAGIRFFQGDAAELDLRGEGTFDTVLIAEVLEHVAAPVGERILANARRVLRPGGRLVVSVPNEKCIPHPNHVRTFDVRALRALLTPFGTPVLVADQPYKWLVMYADGT